MRGYLDALVLGQSRDEAYADHLQPIVTLIDGAVWDLEKELRQFRRPR